LLEGTKYFGWRREKKKNRSMTPAEPKNKKYADGGKIKQKKNKDKRMRKEKYNISREE
jgi:hypothetical protein